MDENSTILNPEIENTMIAQILIFKEKFWVKRNQALLLLLLLFLFAILFDSLIKEANNDLVSTSSVIEFSSMDDDESDDDFSIGSDFFLKEFRFFSAFNNLFKAEKLLSLFYFNYTPRAPPVF